MTPATSATTSVTKVLMTSTSFPSDTGDWRGVFIRHMAEALARRPELAMSLWAPPGECTGPISRASTQREQQMLASLMQSGGIAHLLRRHPVRGLLAAARLLRGTRAACMRADADIYHVNWLQNALALPRDGRPALVTALGTDLQLLRLPGMVPLLKRAFRHRRVVLCPNAAWMLEPLRKHFSDVADVVHVALGIDPRWFEVSRTPPGDGTPDWLVVSRLTRGKLGTLFEWAAPHFKGSGRRLHLFGPMQESLDIPDWVIYHGPTTPDALCDKWFPRAAGLITLSAHAEGRPQVMLEAMASGLPVIVSRLPAHADLIEDGGTGRIVDTPEQLGQALVQLGDWAFNLAMGQAARSSVMEHTGTWDDCAARYAAQYAQLLRGANA